MLGRDVPTLRSKVEPDALHTLEGHKTTHLVGVLLKKRHGILDLLR